MGTPFSGPPFLQSGVSRPQTAFFSQECTYTQARNIVPWECNFSSELINLNLVKITAWLEIQGPAAKLNGANRFFTRASNFYRSHYLKTRSSADADNRLDAFSCQSRSTNTVPFSVHCDFSLSIWSAPRTKKLTNSLRHFHSSSVL